MFIIVNDNREKIDLIPIRKYQSVLLLLLTLLLISGCERRIIPGNPFEVYYEEEEEKVPEEDASNNDCHGSLVSLCEYEPISLFVPKGTSLEDALLRSQPQLSQVKSLEGVGGAKLIAEMSADAAGIPYSRDNGQDRIIKIQPMHILKIHIDTIPPCIFSRIMKKEVILRSCVINSTPSIFDEHFDVNIVLTNNTGIPLDVTIRQGTMIESETENVQNIVVTKHYNVSLPPLQTSSMSVLAYCAAHHRSSPSGRRGRITPYVLNAPSSVYNTQQAVWDYIEAPARNKMTFYAWGKGDDTGRGRVSQTGHAFVYIPRSGFWGFSTLDELINGEGAVYDHSSSRKYATDSCSVYITDYQLNEVYETLDVLLLSPPRYTIGWYDCTSFAMDIADAAGVYYGSRWLIQTPIGFMEQLKKYNK